MLTWALILLAAAIVLMLIETLMPGGVIGAIGALFLIAGIVVMFFVDPTLGVITLGVFMVIVPIGVIVALRWFPTSPIGRRLTLSTAQQPDSVVYDPNVQAAAELIDATGVAISDLRPVGVCRINDLRLECLAEAGVIEAGRRVKVVSVVGNEITVRAV